MMFKDLAKLALLIAIVQAPALVSAQASDPSDSGQLTPPTSTHAPKAQGRPDCNGVPCEDQQPRVIVNLPPPAPTPWALHDRIAWAAYLTLAILGYVGVMLAVSTLKKVERNTSAAETAATAAAETAQAALLHAQAIINAERPWLLIGVEPTLGVENSFNVTATNRGRSPATIISTLDQILFAVDEAHLPATPVWKPAEPGAPFTPMIVLPGEFATIRTVKREDAKELCGSEEKFKSIEEWNERLFICGRVLYNDLIAPAGRETHETNWCCWYIHGRQKSGLAIAGTPAFHAHT
jgi:hypothetical protein